MGAPNGKAAAAQLGEVLYAGKHIRLARLDLLIVPDQLLSGLRQLDRVLAAVEQRNADFRLHALNRHAQ